ncbi:MAG: triose-phosphate isomerase [Pseudomonadota bacterium]
MRCKIVAGNWKMNGSLALNSQLLAALKAAAKPKNCELVVCVPAPYFWQCQQALMGSGIGWGAQDISAHEAGAYTGEISAAMLSDFACEYVIVGHSERRACHGESNGLVAAKAVRAVTSGLTPIVCVGETLVEREAGQADAVVGRQIDAVVDAVDPSDLSKIIIAYEPVWAIGTGKVATPQMAQEVHAKLRSRIEKRNSAAAAIRIIYGGSMKPDHAKELMAMPDIDGGLIGGAALSVVDFLAIAEAVN